MTCVLRLLPNEKLKNMAHTTCCKEDFNGWTSSWIALFGPSNVMASLLPLGSRLERPIVYDIPAGSDIGHCVNEHSRGISQEKSFIGTVDIKTVILTVALRGIAGVSGPAVAN